MNADLLWLLAGLLAPQEPGAASYLGGYPAQDALLYDVHLTLDLAQQRVEGGCDYSFQAVTELQEIVLDSLAGDDWQVQFTDPGGAVLAARRAGQTLVVSLAEPVPAGGTARFAARFHGRPPDGLYFRSTRHGEDVVFTDHFSTRARGWLPCEDHPADRAEFRLRFTVPRELEVIASGKVSRVAGESAPQDPLWASWQALPDAPISSYLLAFAVGPYARVAEPGDERLVPHYVYQKDVPRARRGLQHHAAWMAIMERTFGPYAYAKYCVVQVPTRWGGMENAGNTWINEGLFDAPDYGAGVLAHEFAHQWFGDAVGYGEWHDAWLSEGFASYLGPWLDEQTGGPSLRNKMNAARADWLRRKASFSLPIRWTDYQEPDEFFGRASVNTYQKGAWVLHMLRGELGDEPFFAGLRAYYQANFGRAVDSGVLQAALEQQAGRSLDWFFRQWLERPGCPELSFEWREGGVMVRQNQAGDPYRLRLPLGWKDAGGAAHKRYFELREQESFLELGAGYTAPVIDPDVELLFRKV